MNPRRKRPPVKKEKKSSAMTIVYSFVLIIALSALGWWFFNEYNYRNQYNQVMSLLDKSFKDDDSKGVEECLKNLELMQKEHSSKPERVKLINMNLVKCYRHFAMKYDLSLKGQIEYLRKIEAISPSDLTDEDKKLLEFKF